MHPDSKSILVPGSPRRFVEGFYLFDIEAGKKTPLLEIEREEGEGMIGVWPDMSPDGNTLYYLSGDRMKLMKYDSSRDKKNILYESEKRIAFTALSPDGNYMAFRYDNEKPNDLWIMPADGGEARLMGSLDEGERIFCPEWSPDSRQVIVIAWESKELYSFPIEGGEPTKLDLILEDGRHLSIHPDGKRIVFSHLPRSGFDIYVMENFLPKTKDKK